MGFNTMEFSKPFFQTFRPDLNAALELLAKKHGISLSAGNITFDPVNGTATIKVLASTKSKGNPRQDVRDNKDVATYSRWRLMLGLPPLLSEFIDRGERFSIVGMRVGGPYKSVICKSLVSNKLYKFRSQDLIRILKSNI